MIRPAVSVPASSRWSRQELHDNWLAAAVLPDREGVSPAAKHLRPDGALGGLLREGKIFRDIGAWVELQANGAVPGDLVEEKPSGYYFLHIPKSAGTSLSAFLDRIFSDVTTSRAWLWDQIWPLLSNGVLQPYVFFRGHLHLAFEPIAKRRLMRFTVLREPVARTISHYRHVRRAPDHPYHSLTRNQSLLEFCQHSETRHMVENYQARYLVDFGLDPHWIGHILTPEEMACFALQTLLELTTLRLIPDDLLLAAARSNLSAHFAVVGVTDELESAAQRMASAAGRPPVPLEQLNVTPGERMTPETLDPETHAAIASLTSVDRELYRFAAEIANAGVISYDRFRK